MPRLPRSTPAPSQSTTSTVLNHTIPPHYACYLLRSLKPRGGTYIGSTPDPPRRFKQHSGEIKGGAWKTQRGRPWEMEVNVYGFPSKLQALQFEWAWQNPHASRHLHSPPLSAILSTSAVTTAEKPVAQFPKSALSNRPLTKLQVLQFMLTVAPWRSFGLKVLLYSKDAKSWWDEARRLGPVARTDAGVKKWKKERLAAGIIGEDPWEERGKVLDGTKVEIWVEGVDGRRLVREGKREEDEKGERIRVDDDDFFDPHWQKWDTISDASPVCEICSKAVDTDDHLSFLLCTAPPSVAALAPCTATYHLPCLSKHFLATSLPALASAAPTATRALFVLPTSGTCPACLSPLHWVDLVRGAYRRKEEDEGTRKRRKFEKGSKDAVGRKRTKNANAGDKDGKGKKGKAASVSEGEGSSDEERFEFSSGEESGEISDEEQEEDERSWAVSVAAEGALEDILEEGQREVDMDDWLNDAPPPFLPQPVPTSPKKRGRPPKIAAAAVPPSPPKAAKTSTTSRRAPAAVATKKKATLASAFTSTKSSTSTATTSTAAKPRAINPPSNSDDDLLPPLSLLAQKKKGTGRDKAIAVDPPKKARPPTKKKVAYVELSD
ncbi:hypothetical protein JCM11641_007720 [Rhodosporidiobolus odoratus]